MEYPVVADLFDSDTKPIQVPTEAFGKLRNPMTDAQP
jgi:hypothetical protein